MTDTSLSSPHAAYLLSKANEELAHDRLQNIPLSLISDKRGSTIRAMVLDQSTIIDLIVNPMFSTYLCLEPVKGKNWLLVTSSPIEPKAIKNVVTWLLRNYGKEQTDGTL